ncbi:unnamed protein product [Phytophthora fragariaefolia]|uniref:Unnamed protein product n=1 Tax=Phytophthora fragariaefolia TaxID=1490495 RepID=A0A9W6XXV8_9STRA|nr:unnamed protein product [Phytophthora fragariaefolia]
MTIIDTSTRLLEIAAMIDRKSAEAARIVDQRWLNRYPRPERCIYDQGSEFAAEFTELLDSYGVQRDGTTAKKPQANSTIKRVHRTINDKLRTEQITTLRECENCLSAVMFATRAKHHTAIGLSPGQAAVGRDILFDYRTTVNWEQQQKRKEEQIQKNHARENSKRSEHEYRPDDQVMVARNNLRAPKLQQAYDGPFRVISIRSDGILVMDGIRYQESIQMRRAKLSARLPWGRMLCHEGMRDGTRPDGSRMKIDGKEIQRNEDNKTPQS